MSKKTIAIDFDGVIAKRSFYDSTRPTFKSELNYPVEGAFEALIYLISSGFNPVIFTTREDQNEIKEWFKKHWQFEIHLNKEHLAALLEIEITNKKPHAVAFIDDRALRFTNWPDMLKYFT